MPPPGHHGMVGNQSADGRECSNLDKTELMTAGRPLAVLDLCPSATIKGAPFFTAPSTYTLIWGQSWAQTKQHTQHNRVRRLTSSNGVEANRHIIACRVILPNHKDPVTPIRMFRTSTITRAYIKYKQHNLI